MHNEMGAKLRALLTERSLFSAGTMFKPSRKVGGAATYVPFGKNAARKSAGLDHMCVSRQWLSSVENVRVRWGPSEHRWAIANGQQKDHAMLEMRFRMRIAKKKKVVPVNRAALMTEEGAAAAANAYVAARLEIRGSIIQKEKRALSAERQPGPLSFEELGQTAKRTGRGGGCRQ